MHAVLVQQREWTHALEGQICAMKLMGRWEAQVCNRATEHAKKATRGARSGAEKLEGCRGASKVCTQTAGKFARRSCSAHSKWL